MQKKIDKTGRIVVPKLIRDEARISDGDELEISYNKDINAILLGCVDKKCSICGNSENLEVVNDTLLCKVCVDKIKNL
ncbi:MAG: AbrB/MazE/SpoVT family DNA-binding domain-containing protein [Clostridiales bacterium]|nr:AbrB/MazE/SpoVT family DNA-binding domain-containing protein [Clostridiales bacterium]